MAGRHTLPIQSSPDIRGHRRRAQLIPSGRRASLFAYTCSVPLILLVIFWQHWQLINRLEGGGEYTALVDDGRFDTFSSSYWADGIQQLSNVVQFVAYESGLLSNDDEQDDDDDEAAARRPGSSEDQSNNDLLTSIHIDHGHEKSGSIIPFDLSVNHLKLIEKAPGRPPTPPLPARSSSASVSEDFLPVVRQSDLIFRWRHHPKPASLIADATRVTAYRILVRRLNDENYLLWDSGKVPVALKDEVLTSVQYGASSPPKVGEIVQWRVVLWDMADEPHSSSWSKLAIGPGEENDWKGKWIVHREDMRTFSADSSLNACSRWRKRRPLPMFRARLSSKTLLKITANEDDPLVSGLLVVSGLGSFRASMDGVPLSTSGPIDPPFTDYSKRVMYRGYDVTDFLTRARDSRDDIDGEDDHSHVIGITMGSSWWDHRPILTKSIVKFDLLPRGPVTVMAQLFLSTSKGKMHVVLPTQDGEDVDDVWQVSRGHIRESDLFTGEIVDLGVMIDMDGWDTIESWTNTIDSSMPEPNRWIPPSLYETDQSFQSRWEDISIKAGAKSPKERSKKSDPKILASPIGRLVPSEIPPILPMERISPDEVHNLGSGRWLFDFGKAFSGMLHFDEGIPPPIVPDNYPRGHGFKSASENGDSFITVIYGESLEMSTGDINRVLVAGLGLHDGGPRHVSNPKGYTDDISCFPPDHDGILSQRDVFVIAKEKEQSSRSARAHFRQPHFTTHAFRFAEVCCTKDPPSGVHALLYRTAVPNWGSFSSSSVLLNGGYELVKNAMVSNMLSVQSDCPHREKLPYGGDLVANSPAALHFFDMSAFYKKTVLDWLDSQWDNGAYTETSVWQDLNDYAGIGQGAGETVWASAPPVLTVRYFQHYDDVDFLGMSAPNHIRWLDFLNHEFSSGMKKKGFAGDLKGYEGDGSGLGDWLALRDRDTWLTHTAFYMASARAVAYISNVLGDKDTQQKALAHAEVIRTRISHLYLKNGKDSFDFPEGHDFATPGPEMSLFSRIVPGEKRCIVLKNYFKRSGSKWPGDEEKLFLNELKNKTYIQELLESGELTEEDDTYWMGWSQWQGFNEGIFGIRYSLKTLSDMGFHHIALRKASGFGFGTPEYMLRHNATSLWETWWRSEDLYSRNHPMLGALAEWMSSSVAGVALHPTTTGGRKVLYWPRFPKSAAMIQHASAIQGTQIGDFAIAWRFENLPSNRSQYKSAAVKIRIRFLIPPGGKAILRLPLPTSQRTKVWMSKSDHFPDLFHVRNDAKIKCKQRRSRRLGFPFSWEYDRKKKEWFKFISGKAIGTPCESFLFGVMPLDAQWSSHTEITKDIFEMKDKTIMTGMYEIIINNWQLEPEVEGGGRLGNIPEYFHRDFNAGPYCEDRDTFNWHINDATHII